MSAMVYGMQSGACLNDALVDIGESQGASPLLEAHELYTYRHRGDCKINIYTGRDSRRVDHDQGRVDSSDCIQRRTHITV